MHSQDSNEMFFLFKDFYTPEKLSNRRLIEETRKNSIINFNLYTHSVTINFDGNKFMLAHSELHF